MVNTDGEVHSVEGKLTPVENTATPMIDRAMRQIHGDNGLSKTPVMFNQPSTLLESIANSLRDVYGWACENRREDMGLLYDLNTAIETIERCVGRVR